MVKDIRIFPMVEAKVTQEDIALRTAEIARLQQTANSFGATLKYVVEVAGGVLIGFETKNPEALSVILRS